MIALMIARTDGPSNGGFPLEAGKPAGIGGDLLGEDLDRDVAPELEVTGAIHLTHASHANRVEDFVRAEPRSGGE